MSARIIPFPARGPFTVRIVCEGKLWLVVCRDHGWLFADRREAIAEAKDTAAGFGVAIKVAS
jgi:hypothetical protein